MKLGGITALALSAFALAGCQTLLFKEKETVAPMGVSFSWKETHKCSSTPPSFYISGIPKGTKTLEFKMTDLNALSFPHGGGTVPYTGTGKIPEGAFTYTGPCPPDGAEHRYEFEVTAYGETGDKVLGRGKASRNFPPK